MCGQFIYKPILNHKTMKKAAKKMVDLVREIHQDVDASNGGAMIVLLESPNEDEGDLISIIGSRRDLAILLASSMNSDPRLKQLVQEALYLDSLVPDEVKSKARSSIEVEVGKTVDRCPETALD